MNLSQSNRLPILAAGIKTEHGAIERDSVVLAERALATGGMLIEAKAIVPHGQWADWVQWEAGLSPRTARRYMQLAQSGMKSATVADLGIRGAAAAVAKATRTPSRKHAERKVDAWFDELSRTVPLDKADLALREVEQRAAELGVHYLEVPELDAIVRRHLTAEKVTALSESLRRFESDVARLTPHIDAIYGRVRS